MYTYYMVVILGNNYALAINYEDSSSPEMSKNYRFCNSYCVMHPITEAHWRPRAGKKQEKLQLDQDEEDEEEEEEQRDVEKPGMKNSTSAAGP
jgi:hypothetical protein